MEDGDHAINNEAFETFTVFIRSNGALNVLLGVRVASGKYCVVSNYKLYREDVVSMEHFLVTSRNASFTMADALFADFSKLFWFNSKAEAIKDYVSRFRGFLFDA